MMLFFEYQKFPSAYSSCVILDKPLKLCLNILICKMRMKQYLSHKVSVVTA